MLTFVPPGTDGFLRMSEVMSLKMNADVVALTACQSGLGKLISGEGTMGMGRAFHYAGAKSVLMSLWNVSEKASVDLVGSFFKYQKQGKSKLDSLRLARAEIRQAGYDHPFFWAPFILVGETGTDGDRKTASLARGSKKNQKTATKAKPEQANNDEIDPYAQQILKGFITTILDTALGTKRLKELFAKKNMVDKLQEKAEQKDPKAQFLYGLYQSTPWGVVGDDQVAESFIKKSADQGYGLAQALMSAIAHESDLEQKKKEAWSWLEKAGRNNDIPTQVLLTSIVFDRQLFGKNPGADNADFALKCAREGNPFFQCLVGDMYSDGYGVTQDKQQAAEWYKKSADQDYAIGQLAYGFHLHKNKLSLNGDQSNNAPQDKKKGAELILAAAKQGLPFGEFAAGLMHAEGDGVDKDLVKARGWLKKAADQGLKEAKKELTKLSGS